MQSIQSFLAPAGASLEAQVEKNRLSWVRSLSGGDPLGEGMTAHSSTLAWRIPRPEEPGEVQSDTAVQLTL